MEIKVFVSVTTCSELSLSVHLSGTIKSSWKKWCTQGNSCRKIQVCLHSARVCICLSMKIKACNSLLQEELIIKLWFKWHLHKIQNHWHFSWTVTRKVKKAYDRNTWGGKCSFVSGKASEPFLWNLHQSVQQLVGSAQTSEESRQNQRSTFKKQVQRSRHHTVHWLSQQILQTAVSEGQLQSNTVPEKSPWPDQGDPDTSPTTL